MEYTNLRNYETQLNQVIEKLFNQFYERLEILSLNNVKTSFWGLVDNIKTFNPLDWYDIFSIFIIRLSFTQILLDEGRIIQEISFIFIFYS